MNGHISDFLEAAFIFTLIAITVGLIALYIYVVVVEHNDCRDKGGQIEGAGEYQTTYVMSGKVMVPVTNEITECSK